MRRWMSLHLVNLLHAMCTLVVDHMSHSLISPDATDSEVVSVQPSKNGDIEHSE